MSRFLALPAFRCCVCNKFNKNKNNGTTDKNRILSKVERKLVNDAVGISDYIPSIRFPLRSLTNGGEQYEKKGFPILFKSFSGNITLTKITLKTSLAR